VLFVWASPVVVFVVLLMTRRFSAVVAALCAVSIAVLVVAASAPKALTAAELIMTAAAGAWIALPAVVVILAGVFFSESLITGEAASPADRTNATARELGTTCFFLGPFFETATGFGVGFIITLRRVLGMGIAPASAIALAALSQCLVPWGALGVGTRISAALAEVPVYELGWRAGIVIAPAILLLLPIFWRIATSSGFNVSVAQRFEDVMGVALLLALLIAANFILPIELAGLVAIGLALLVRIWRADGRQAFQADALRAAGPYVALIGLLAITRLVPPISEWLGSLHWTPGYGAPAFAPLLSPAIPLLLVTLVFAICRGQRNRLPMAARAVVLIGWRAAVMTLLLVILAWMLVRSGIAAEVAADARTALGGPAQTLVPLLGALGGYLTGSNTGAGGLSMPIAGPFVHSAAALAWLCAAAIASGSLMTAVSPVRLVMGQGLAKATASDMRSAFRKLMPYLVVALATGVVPALVLLA
jgi:lactate permease